MPSADTQMRYMCVDVVTKQECVETIDIISVRPIDGKIKIFQQGKGVKTGYRVVANYTSKEEKDSNCIAISDGVMVSKATAAYSGTPYTITTLRYMK